MKYTVFNGDTATDLTRSNKQAAIDLATALRDSEKVAVSVVTDKNTVVFEQPAPKKINMSPRHTRVVELPEGVEIPEGTRAAYFRPRVGLVELHRSGEDIDPAKAYSVFDVKKGKELKPRFATTRLAGDFMTKVALERKEAKAAAEAEAAQETPAPAPVEEPATA